MKLSSIFILLTIFFTFLTQAKAEDIKAGKFVFIRGDVTINRLVNKKLSQIKAKNNDTVYKSDVIETNGSAAARIRLIDSNQIDIYPKTKLTISEYIYKPAENKKNVELSIDFGKVQSTVHQKYDGTKNTYRVKTPGIVAGVRGTIFTVGYESGRSTTSVTEGIVDVRINSPDQASSAARSSGAIVKPQQKVEFLPSQNKIEVLNFNQSDIEKIKVEREIFKEADVKIEDKKDQSQKSINELNSIVSEVVDLKKEKSESSLNKNSENIKPSVDSASSSLEQTNDEAVDREDKKIKGKLNQAKDLLKNDRATEALENARGQQIKDSVSKGMKAQEKSPAELGAARRSEALQRKLKELNNITETTNAQSKERLKQQAEEEAARKKAEELATETKRLAEEAAKKAEEAAAKEKAESGN